MNETNLYVAGRLADSRQPDPESRGCATSTSRLQRERKTGSTTFSAPTTTTSSRGSGSPTRRSGTSGFLGGLSGGPGSIAFHAGFGIYDGRIFQSVFSQGGANVRFNPPNALDRTLINAAERAQRVRPVARFRLHTRAADRQGRDRHCRTRTSRCRRPRSGTSRSSGSCRGTRR